AEFALHRPGPAELDVGADAVGPDPGGGAVEPERLRGIVAVLELAAERDQRRGDPGADHSARRRRRGGLHQELDFLAQLRRVALAEDAQGGEEIAQSAGSARKRRGVGTGQTDAAQGAFPGALELES